MKYPNETIGEHLAELRKLLLRVAITFVCFLGLFYIGSVELIKYLTNVYNLSAIKPYESFSAILNLDIYLSVLFTMPVLIYSIWKWAHPIFENKIHLKTSVTLSIILFYSGFGFGILIFNNIILDYFSNLSISLGVSSVWSITQFIDFVFKNSIFIGLMFQLPIIIFSLLYYEVVSFKSILRSTMPLVLVILIISAYITPPDAFSMFVLVIPVILLIGLTLLISKLALWRKTKWHLEQQK